MSIAQSKVTARGHVFLPAEIRKKLGVGPGSVLEWDEKSGEVVVRRAARYTSAQIHTTLFGTGLTPNADAKDGIRKYIRRRYAHK